MTAVTRCLICETIVAGRCRWTSEKTGQNRKVNFKPKMFCISLCVTGRELTDTEGEMAFFSAGPWLIVVTVKFNYKRGRIDYDQQPVFARYALHTI